MKPKLILATAISIVLILAVGGLQLSHNHASSSTVCSQSTTGSESHTVMLMDNKVEPATIDAKLCDSLTFMSMDAQPRSIVFGPQDDQVPYDGIAQKILHANQSFTITLNKPGTFQFEDHSQPALKGSFTVTR